MPITSSNWVPVDTALTDSTSAAQRYFVALEWSMGNGQCPECFGNCPNWNDFGINAPQVNTGHKSDCLFALAMVEVGLTPAMRVIGF